MNKIEKKCNESGVSLLVLLLWVQGGRLGRAEESCAFRSDGGEGTGQPFTGAAESVTLVQCVTLQ